MEQNKKNKGIYYFMRTWHRVFGYLAIGITLVYALSGIVLNYRNTNFMKTEKQVERTITPGLTAEELGTALRLPGFKVIESTDDIINFNSGSYNSVTGEVNYSSFEYVFPFNKFSKLHKSVSSNGLHLFGVIYGIILLFLAVSSYWMHKPGTKHYKDFFLYGGIGIAAAILLLILI